MNLCVSVCLVGGECSRAQVWGPVETVNCEAPHPVTTALQSEVAPFLVLATGRVGHARHACSQVPWLRGCCGGEGEVGHQHL